MTEYIGINTRPLIKNASSAVKHSRQSADLNRFVQMNAKKVVAQNRDHNHLESVRSAALGLGQSLISILNIARRNAHIQIGVELENGFRPPKQKGRVGFSNITLIQEKSFVRKNARSVGLIQKESKEHISIIQKNFVSDGYVNRVIFAGIKRNRRTAHIQFPYKYTGKKAELING
jgi:hypothetical protein